MDNQIVSTIITIVPIVTMAIMLIVTIVNIARRIKKIRSESTIWSNDVRDVQPQSQQFDPQDLLPPETIKEELPQEGITDTTDTYLPPSPPAYLPPSLPLSAPEKAEITQSDAIIYLSEGKATTYLQDALQYRNMKLRRLSCLTHISEKDLLAIADGTIPASPSWYDENETSQALIRLKKLVSISRALKMKFDSLFPLRYVSLMCAPVDVEECMHLLFHRASRHLIYDDSLDSTFDTVTENLLRRDIRYFLRGLDDRSRQVIEMRYGFFDMQEHTLSDVAESLGLTREEVRNIEARALRRLRYPIFHGRMREYYTE